MAKGQEHPGVYATSVMDFIPLQQVFPHKMVMISCDDVLEDEITSKSKIANNDLMLLNFNDQFEAIEKLALYKYQDSTEL